MSRFITLTTTIVVFVSYANLSEDKDHLVVDHIVTYPLLIEALMVEIYAFILVVSFRWTTHYFAIKGPGAFCNIQVYLHFLTMMVKRERKLY